jgi:hypothetical protein
MFTFSLALRASSDTGEFVALIIVALISLLGGVAMGVRLVRGPAPPEI